MLTKNTKGQSLVLYRIGFSLELAREIEIFLGFAFQPSESMWNISTIRSFQEFMAIGLYPKKNCAMFSINSSFLCRLQLSIGTVGARLSFRALLRHVTMTLSPFQVMSLASSEESLVSVLD